MEIQTLMKGYSCYTAFDNAKLTLRQDAVVVPMSTYTHQLCIHKYCDLHYWWTVVAWYLTDQVKYDQVLEELADLALCSVKSWINVNEPKISEVDY